MSDDIVMLAEFSDRNEAKVVQSLLASNGIKSDILTDNAGGMYPNLSFSRGTRLLIREEDLEAAKRVLAEQR